MQRPEINILFSDVVLPHGISGLELARLVREQYPKIRIVLTSGYPIATLRREHGEPSEFTFIDKPYRLADLAKAPPAEAATARGTRRRSDAKAAPGRCGIHRAAVEQP